MNKNNNENNSVSTESRYCSYDEIPLLLDANDLIRLLGLSRTNVYYLLQANDFPTIVIGKRRLVQKDKLFDWLKTHEQVKKR